MAILVTGGTGYIGSHTVVELLSRGEDIIIIDNLSNSKENVINKIEIIAGIRPALYIGDIRDKNLLQQIFSDNHIESVIHFAGSKAVGESVAKPLEYFDNNVYGSIVLLQVMKEFNCKKIVFSSSATVYGLNDNVPFDENTPLSVTNPYGRTKLMIEDILRDLYISDNEFSIALLRYFNPIGAHSSGLIGEDPNDIPNNLLPFVTKVASKEYEILSIFGNDYDTKDGTGVRDYIHVVDLANGHLSALDFVREKNCIEAFNLGTGTGYSVLEIVEVFKKVNNVDVPYKIVERRHGDIGKCFANPLKSKEYLGWQAKYDINQMCLDAWNFIIKSKKDNI